MRIAIALPETLDCDHQVGPHRLRTSIPAPHAARDRGGEKKPQCTKHQQPRNVVKFLCPDFDGAEQQPLIGEIDDAQSALDVYKPAYDGKLDQLLHAKLGLQTVEPDDTGLIEAMFSLLQANHADFTLFFRRLGELRRDDDSADGPLRDLFIDRAAFDAWAAGYRARLRRENSEDAARRAAMHAVNPKYVLRNYLAQIAIEKAQNKDFSEIGSLLAVLEKPFDEQPGNEHYARLPPDWASTLEVSCSS